MRFQITLKVKRPLTVVTWLMSLSHTQQIRSIPHRSIVHRAASLLFQETLSSIWPRIIRKRTPAWAQAWASSHLRKTLVHTLSIRIRTNIKAIMPNKYHKASHIINHRNNSKLLSLCSWDIMGHSLIAPIRDKWILIMLNVLTRP